MITFTKVKLPYGWLGNMAPYPVTYEGKEYRTTEALFQALRFDDDEVIEEIRAEKSPMSAKMIAKKHKEKMVIVPCGPRDLMNMRKVIGLKVEQHPELKEMLIGTGDETIIEDCTKRDRGSARFWGAVLVDGEWEGKNFLGKIWMIVRNYR
jgi:ribA/ribD-fused uncharacterized protein